LNGVNGLFRFEKAGKEVEKVKRQHYQNVKSYDATDNFVAAVEEIDEKSE